MSRTIARLFYRYVCKRTSTFVLGMVVTSVFFERAYDHACESIFETINEGRLWMHIKDRYESPTEESAQVNRSADSKKTGTD